MSQTLKRVLIEDNISLSRTTRPKATQFLSWLYANNFRVQNLTPQSQMNHDKLLL